ncbi:hypothetical protein GGS21DRAFT_384275 [Xylaria nigripes]|nr:hypothetical protein GGS21DRAFT_384275 [Xylaria nigripes]
MADWFASDGPNDQGPRGWRLDVVTLLAVIGESSIAEHSQTITASMFCLLPRIIPAPQALLKPSRPQRLPETNARMIGVYSGVVLDTVGFFANIVHPLDELQPFAFKVLEIKHKNSNVAGNIDVRQPATARNASLLERFRAWRTGPTLPTTQSVRGPPPDTANDKSGNVQGRTTGLSISISDIEAGPNPSSSSAAGATRRPTKKEKFQDFVANSTLAGFKDRPAIPATLYSPLHILAVVSTLLTFAIIGFAASEKDGTAILAISMISAASSIVGWASWWRPILMNRKNTNKVPAGDVIIRTREGAFMLVKCTEDVARELYSGTEECEYYIEGQAYRLLMGLGTFLLMVSVILLGNCKWHSQLFIGSSYIVLNGLYWTLSLLPQRYFWDLSRYEIKDVTPLESQGAHEVTEHSDPREGSKSFTRTLWYAIRETKRTAWVRRSGAAPGTPQWNAWLAEAEAAAKAENIRWPAVARKDEIMKMSEDSPVKTTAHDFDAAEQAVPAVQVQLHERHPGQNHNF